MDSQNTAFEAEISRILQSATFARSKRGCALLSYIGRETSAGRGDAISEISIAQDVLGRGEEFNAAQDTVVRVQMRRLRDLLEKYYAEEAPDQAQRILLPLGGYAAEIWQDPSVAQPPKFRFGLGILAVAFFGLCAALILFVLIERAPTSSKDMPIVTILPFENLTGDVDQDILEVGLQRQLASEMSRSRLVGVQISVDIDGGDRPDEKFELSGAILSAEMGLDVVLSLSERPTGDVLSTRRYMTTSERETFADLVLKTMQHATGNLAGPSGSIAQHILEASETDPAIFSDRSVCLAVLGGFLSRPSDAAFDRAQECLRTGLNTPPDDAERLSYQALMAFFGTTPFHLLPHRADRPSYRIGEFRRLANEAVASDPSLDVAQMAHGLAETVIGRHETAIVALAQATRLNPSNAQAFALLSLAQARNGLWPDAVLSAERARARSSDPSPMMHMAPLLFHLSSGNQEAVLEHLEHVLGTDADYGPILELLVAQSTDDLVAVDHLRPTVEMILKSRPESPLGGLELWVPTGPIRMRVFDLLREAGIPWL